MSAPTASTPTTAVTTIVEHLHEARTLLRLAPTLPLLEIPRKDGPAQSVPTKAAAIAQLNLAKRELETLIAEVTAS